MLSLMSVIVVVSAISILPMRIVVVVPLMVSISKFSAGFPGVSCYPAMITIIIVSLAITCHMSMLATFIAC